MHTLVKFIVTAESAEEANNQADYAAPELVEQREFDWYHEGQDSPWKECWQPIRLSEEKAKALVQEAIDEQFREFKDTLATIRFMLARHTDEQIFNERFDQSVSERLLSRHQFTVASGYGVSQALYGEEGCAIINQRELNRYLDEPKGLWVVQVDCHS
jgi:hypothetical protein